MNASLNAGDHLLLYTDRVTDIYLSNGKRLCKGKHIRCIAGWCNVTNAWTCL